MPPYAISSDAHALSARFLNAWPRFRELSQSLSEAVLDDVARPVWAWRCPDAYQARESAARIFDQFFYEDEQDAKETVILPGLMGVSEHIIRMAHALNARRAGLRDVLRALDRESVKITNPVTGRMRKERLGDLVLADAGLARLHRVQVYRDIHVLEQAPLRASFVWARTRRVKRLSVDEVRERVRRLLNNSARAPFAEEDLSRLRNLSSKTVLAHVEPMPCHARVNLTWPSPDGDGVIRAMRAAPMPLIYPAEHDSELPPVRPLNVNRDGTRLRPRRSDVCLESQPYLKTLSIYRYRNQSV